MDSAPGRTSSTSTRGWESLEVGQHVVLTHSLLMTIAGTVDAMTEDQDIIWVTSVPQRRRIIHIDDGYRVCQEGH